jgi:hypothetical protein
VDLPLIVLSPPDRPGSYSLVALIVGEATHPLGFFSHHTALGLHELTDVNPAKPDLTVPPGFRKGTAIPSILRLHLAEVGTDEVKTSSVFRSPTHSERSSTSGARVLFRGRFCAGPSRKRCAMGYWRVGKSHRQRGTQLSRRFWAGFRTESRSIGERQSERIDQAILDVINMQQIGLWFYPQADHCKSS